MIRVFVALALVTLLAASTSHAQWRDDGAPVADDAWGKSSGAFGAMLLVTDRMHEFLQGWARPQSLDYTPRLRTATKVGRGDTILVVVLHQGCAAGAANICDTDVDYRIVFPDRSILVEHLGGELWKGEPTQGAGLRLATIKLALEIGTDHPPGQYLIEAVVRDNNAGISLQLARELTVTEAPSFAWMSDYYLSPAPERFVVEVRRMSVAGALPRSDLPMTVFLAEVMAANEDKIHTWLEQLNDLPEASRELLIDAAWMSRTASARDYLIREGRESMLNRPPTDVLAVEPTSAEVLDAWWAYFFGTGDKVAIRRLVSAFELWSGGSLSDIDVWPPEDSEQRRQIDRDLVFNAALWSIGSNIEQHSRIAQIAEAMFYEETLRRNEKMFLAMALAKGLPDKYRVRIEDQKFTLDRVKRKSAASGGADQAEQSADTAPVPSDNR